MYTLVRFSIFSNISYLSKNSPSRPPSGGARRRRSGRATARRRARRPGQGLETISPFLSLLPSIFFLSLSLCLCISLSLSSISQPRTAAGQERAGGDVAEPPRGAARGAKGLLGRTQKGS